MSFLESSPTAKEILAFQPSDSLRERSAHLCERNQAGALTVEEKIELDDILRVNHFVNMLKIRTRQQLGDTQKE